MNATQSQALVNELRNSFSRWFPTETELYRWNQLLMVYPQKTGKNAIDKLFWEQGKELAPNRKVFRGIIASDKTEDGEGRPVPQGNAYLICSGIDDEGNGIPGMIVWIGWTSNLIPLHSNPNTDKAIESLKRVYGGRWICYCGLGIKAMLKAQQFRATPTIDAEPVAVEPVEASEPEDFDSNWAMPKEPDSVPF